MLSSDVAHIIDFCHSMIEILVLISLAQVSPLNAHADIFSRARGLNFALDMVRTVLKST